ncbi:uncharacterized protein [Miscanthus floridulus]|uniref:uncharacterized protein isoform X2 n=1 Tax=Miscanthus floridulus TaxID=154761 RepID=UPI003458DAB9
MFLHVLFSTARNHNLFGCTRLPGPQHPRRGQVLCFAQLGLLAYFGSNLFFPPWHSLRCSLDWCIDACKHPTCVMPNSADTSAPNTRHLRKQEGLSRKLSRWT